MCLNIGTHKIVNFPFETNGTVMVLGVPILKHLRVLHNNLEQSVRLRVNIS